MRNVSFRHPLYSLCLWDTRSSLTHPNTGVRVPKVTVSMSPLLTCFSKIWLILILDAFSLFILSCLPLIWPSGRFYSLMVTQVCGVFFCLFFASFLWHPHFPSLQSSAKCGQRGSAPSHLLLGFAFTLEFLGSSGCIFLTLPMSVSCLLFYSMWMQWVYKRISQTSSFLVNLNRILKETYFYTQ